MTKEKKRVLLQIVLFLATIFTTTLVGATYMANAPLHELSFVAGFQFSIPLLLILIVHELGHYFTARYHNVKASLPFFIPFPSILGTMGAVIIQEQPVSKKQSFDIGIAGPLAGLVVTIAFLIYGFTHLPPADYIYEFHPEYKQYGADYASHVYGKLGEGNFAVGNNILYSLLEKLVDDPSRIPNPYEVMHYPFLFSGFIALFFTFLNLIPIGQLDGGHVLYGLVGHAWHKKIASVIFVVFLFYAGLGNEYIDPSKPVNDILFPIVLYVGVLYMALTGLKLSKGDTAMYAIVMFGIQFILAKLFPTLHGYSMFLFFALILGRFIGVEHPQCEIEEPLDGMRKLLGWLALLIFVMCFSPAPFVVM